MALFSSSLNPTSSKSPLATANPFSTTFAPTTAPVVDPSANTSRNSKRKRTSDAHSQQANRSAAYGERTTVKTAQQNIEKLMKVLDKGVAPKKAGKKASARRKSGEREVDDDDKPLTMDELRKRLAEEEEEREDGEGKEEEPKKKKIKYGLDGRPVLPPGITSIAQLEGREKPKKTKQKKAQQVAAPVETQDPDSSDEEPAVPVPMAPMTTLQSSLANKLSSAKFRWLNEQLYTLPSTQAWDLMRKEGGSAFADYHDSHRQQTAAWPSPPLPYIVSAIRKSPAKPSNLIVDLGCGDASLAKLLNGTQGCVVLSYDLVGDVQSLPATTPPTAPRGWVIPGDFLESVPLPGEPGGHEHAADGFPAPAAVQEGGKKKKGKKQAEEKAVVVPQVVDTVVCCLSLMGVNWVGGIYEACRILKTGGVFHIAEVTSRLISNKEFIKLVESFGFHLEEHTAPTTHFDLFRFTKTSFAPLGVVRGQTGWDARLAQGTKIMKGCVYKKR